MDTHDVGVSWREECILMVMCRIANDVEADVTICLCVANAKIMNPLLSVEVKTQPMSMARNSGFVGTNDGRNQMRFR